MYHDYRNAEEGIMELLLSVEGCWLKTELQLETITKISNTLDPRLQKHIANVLQILEIKLHAADVKMEKVVRSKEGQFLALMTSLNLTKGSVKRWKLVLLKESMGSMIKDLKDWQQEFDPSWYLITLIANPKIDQSLQETIVVKNSPTRKLQDLRDTLWRASDAIAAKDEKSLFLDPNQLGNKKQIVSPSSRAFVSWYGSSDDAVLIDTITYGTETNTELATTHVRDLGRVLSKHDPSTSGLLTCRGVIKATPEPVSNLTFDFIFTIPQPLHSPKLLRDHLLSEMIYPLDERLHLAKSLARSVMFVHTSGFVHKNIRPETVVILKGQQSSLGKPYLIGFERFRPAASGSYLQGDSLWEKNLYRHPRRQGTHLEEYYKMQHDIYSLGVCLLEIGLWTSFVCPHGSGYEPGPALDISYDLSTKDKGKGAFNVKRKLTAMAETSLPHRMGTKYTKIVVACLTCLDPDETNQFGKRASLEDEDGLIVGIQFIEKVSILVLLVAIWPRSLLLSKDRFWYR